MDTNPESEKPVIYNNLRKILFNFCPQYENFTMQALSGGLINQMWIVYDSSFKNPKKYIYRIFGESKSNDLDRENQICEILGQKKIGPAIYGVIKNEVTGQIVGRIEE